MHTLWEDSRVLLVSDCGVWGGGGEEGFFPQHTRILYITSVLDTLPQPVTNVCSELDALTGPTPAPRVIDLGSILP